MRTLLCVFLCGLPASLHAHPVPDGEYDRLVTVLVDADRVTVLYRLEVDEITLFRVVARLDDPRARQARSREDLAALYLDRLAQVVPDQVLLRVDDEVVPLRATFKRFDPLDSMQFRIHLEAGLPEPRGGRTRRVELIENNLFPEFPVQKGRLRLALEPRFHGTIREWYEPREVRVEGDEVAEASRTLRLRFTPELETPSPPERRVAVGAATVLLAPTPTPSAAPAPPAEEGERLTDLLDGSRGFGWMMLFAAAFGAAHALTPGHGKTMVAAYLVGERGTARHAVLLGLVVTLTHTGAVILLAWLLAEFLPQSSAARAAATVGFVGGFLILLVGLWLFFRRIADRPDHVHLFAGHGHAHSHGGEHSHSHAEAVPLDRAGWRRLVLLGVGGGLIPCTDAIVLLLYCLASGQMALGVPLLLAFSAGLAAVLVAVGLAVVYAARLGKHTFEGRRWFRLLPIVSSLLVVGIGFWMCADQLAALGATRK